MLKNIVFGVKVATNEDFCQGTVYSTGGKGSKPHLWNMQNLGAIP